MAVAVLVGAWLAAGRALVEPPGASPAPTAPPADGLPVLGQLPDVTLTERSGRPVALGDLRGRVWVATFFFSRCQDTCSLQNARLATLQTALVAAPDVWFVSITIDPEYDTPVVLQRYARTFGADPARWLFLTGPAARISQLAQESFRLSVLRPPVTAGGPTPRLAHASGLVLVDRQGRLRGYYHSEDPADIGRLLRDVQVLRAERTA